MKILLIILVLAALHSCISALETNTTQRRKRFSIFSVVQFPNTQCTLASSTATNIMMGTCYTQSECLNIGGTVSGNCASGFGMCCSITVSNCGSTVSQNCTYIQNPGSPNTFTTTGSCMYTFTANSDICQIRLDFNNFVMANPAATGVCGTDTVRITSASSTGTTFPPQPPLLCGVLTGSHIYMETGRQTNAGNINIIVGTGVAGQIRSWKIKVTQVECSNPNRARSDCLQYYTGIAGNFNSFNYNGGTGQYLANQNFDICIRQEAGYCTIAYSENSGATLAAQKSFNLETTGTALRGACTMAFIIIRANPQDTANGGVLGGADNSDNFCGNYLNPFENSAISGVVTGTVAPFNVGVFARGTLAGLSIGFNLMYMQVPC